MCCVRMCVHVYMYIILFDLFYLDKKRDECRVMYSLDVLVSLSKQKKADHAKLCFSNICWDLIVLDLFSFSEHAESVDICFIRFLVL